MSSSALPFENRPRSAAGGRRVRRTSAGVRAVARAIRLGCRASIVMPDGTRRLTPMLIASEAAIAYEAGESELKWRLDWTRRQVAQALRYAGEPQVLEQVAATLYWTDPIIEDQRAKGAWPWQERVPASRLVG